MPADPRALRYFEMFYPGLLTQLSQLGTSVTLTRLTSKPKRDGIGGMDFSFEWTFSDKTVIEIRRREVLIDQRKPWMPPHSTVANPPAVNLALWARTYYRLQYRPPGISAGRPRTRWTASIATMRC